MPSERFVTLGLARARTLWFSDVSRWATSGTLAMDFVKTVKVDEVRTRLSSGRPFSALLVDGGLPGLDRDLFESAREQHCAVVVVTDDNSRDWASIGASAVLPAIFGPNDLESVLVDHAMPIGKADDIPGTEEAPVPTGGFRARTVAVVGPGGTGVSVLSAALAQGLARDPSHVDTTLLADLALNADQAVLHDARDVFPAVLELVESHRSGSPTAETVRSLTFDITARRYRLLLGLRRHRDWTALRPRALRAAIDGLRRAFTIVVVDIDGDFEGESATGSMDVEERNLLARTTIDVADVVVVVGGPGIKGIHALLRQVRACTEVGVTPDRIVTVVNRAPRRARARAELVRSVTDLMGASATDLGMLSPIFVPERREVEGILHDGVPLPAAIVDPMTEAVQARLRMVREATEPISAPEPELVVPGSLAEWSEEDVTG